MPRKNTFTTEAGIFCRKCGKPIEYYSFRTISPTESINGYHCKNTECNNENVIEDHMKIAEIFTLGFEAKEIVVMW